MGQLILEAEIHRRQFCGDADFLPSSLFLSMAFAGGVARA
jgi:hypothetical protein